MLTWKIVQQKTTSINVEPKDLQDRNTLWNQESLRFWEIQISTSHKCSNVCLLMQKERLLRALERDKHAFLEVEKSHFSGPQARKGQFLLMWKFPKDSTHTSLGIVWAHKSIFEHTMESYPSLGSPSIMYQGREEGFEIPYINPPRDEEWVITFLCWPEMPNQYQKCVTPRLLATQQS